MRTIKQIRFGMKLLSSSAIKSSEYLAIYSQFEKTRDRYECGIFIDRLLKLVKKRKLELRK